MHHSHHYQIIVSDIMIIDVLKPDQVQNAISVILILAGLMMLTLDCAKGSCIWKCGAPTGLQGYYNNISSYNILVPNEWIYDGKFYVCALSYLPSLDTIYSNL